MLRLSLRREEREGSPDAAFGHPVADESAGNFANVVTLVEHENLGLREDPIGASVLEDLEVGEEHVVVRHDDVGVLGGATRAEPVTNLEKGARAAETILARSGEG